MTLDALMRKAASWLFGEDIFLSYSRRDGSQYVAALANRLSPKYAVFFDQLGTPPGKQVPAQVLRKARGAHLFAILASPTSVASDAIGAELTAFDGAKRPIVAVDVGGALRQAKWFPLIEGVSIFTESLDSFNANRPSDELVRVIENAFQYRRRAQRQRRAAAIAVTILAVLAVAIAVALQRLAAVQSELATSSGQLEKVNTTVRSRDLAITAERMLHETPELAARTAAQAFTADPTPEAKAALAASSFSISQVKAILTGQGRRGSIVRYAQDGGTIFVAGESHSITVWPVAQVGKPLSRLEAAPAADRELVTTLELNPAGTYLLSATATGYVRLWRTADGLLVREMEPRHAKSAIARFTRDGSKIVTASTDGNVYVFDVESGRQEVTLPHGTGVYGADFDSSGNLLATSTQQGQVIVWDWRKSAEIPPRFNVGGGIVERVRFVPDSTVVISCASFPAKAWLVGQGERYAFGTGARGRIESCEISNDGKRIALAGESSVVTIWDIATGQPAQTLVGHGSYVYRARFNGDGTRILTAALDHSARVWDLGSGQSLAELWGHRDAVHDAVFSPDGNDVATVGFDGRARVWRIYPGDESLPARIVANFVNIASTGAALLMVRREGDSATLSTFAGGPISGIAMESGSGIQNPMAVAADGRRLAARLPGNAVGVWDTGSGKLVARLEGPPGFTFGLRIDASGARVTGQYQDRIRVWDVDTNRFADHLPTPSSGGLLTAVASDGGRATTVDETQVLRIVDLVTGTSRSLGGIEWRREQVGLAFDPKGTRILLTKPGLTGMRIIDLREPRAKDIDFALNTSFPVTAKAFSHDGTLLATAGLDRVIRVVELANAGSPPLEFFGHSAQIDALAFSRNGACLATGSSDGDVRVWHLDARRLIARYQLADRVQQGGLEFMPDSKHVYGIGRPPGAQENASISSLVTPDCVPMVDVAVAVQSRLGEIAKAAR